MGREKKKKRDRDDNFKIRAQTRRQKRERERKTDGRTDRQTDRQAGRETFLGIPLLHLSLNRKPKTQIRSLLQPRSLPPTFFFFFFCHPTGRHWKSKHWFTTAFLFGLYLLLSSWVGFVVLWMARQPNHATLPDDLNTCLLSVVRLTRIVSKVWPSDEGKFRTREGPWRCFPGIVGCHVTVIQDCVQNVTVALKSFLVDYSGQRD